MPRRNNALWLLPCLGCFVLGASLGTPRPGSLVADSAPARPAAPAFPMAARLGANLYLQTSAEYRACCLQTYRCAADRLETLLREARPRPAKPAVVMDLDETVLDNSAFQNFLYGKKLEYSDALWDWYEENYPDEVALVPGAGPFIARAESLGVTVVFLSNRSEVFRTSTEKALTRLGVGSENLAERLYLKPVDGSSDKSPRRDAVAARYNVLLFIGDNLRDFAEVFAAPKLAGRDAPAAYREAVRRRQQQVDDASCHWGVDWFVLPNPVYGEWEKLLGADPQARLRPTGMKAPQPAARRAD